MKKLISTIIQWIKRKIRKRQFEKRQEIYDDVINKLTPKLEEKFRLQEELKAKLIANFKKDTGVSYGSEFIPTQGKNQMHILQIINNKYGEEMREKGVTLNYDLEFICA